MKFLLNNYLKISQLQTRGPHPPPPKDKVIEIASDMPPKNKNKTGRMCENVDMQECGQNNAKTSLK